MILTRVPKYGTVKPTCLSPHVNRPREMTRIPSKKRQQINISMKTPFCTLKSYGYKQHKHHLHPKYHSADLRIMLLESIKSWCISSYCPLKDII